MQLGSGTEGLGGGDNSLLLNPAVQAGTVGEV